ncbi:transposase [Streptomyces asoensis]|uniref:Transposase n=1 Tax=Streptomyces asoensis TaxID=249586 RepID=A0A6M4X0M0_9ACTN|nr:transposase [Streptomyces asoensis]
MSSPSRTGCPAPDLTPRRVNRRITEQARRLRHRVLPQVSRRKDQDGFAVLAKRWRVERAISWIMRARRNVRDYQRLISHSEAHITWTSITLMVRRLTRPPRPPRHTPSNRRKTAAKPKPIRIRMQQPQAIRLAPTVLRLSRAAHHLAGREPSAGRPLRSVSREPGVRIIRDPAASARSGSHDRL